MVKLPTTTRTTTSTDMKARRTTARSSGCVEFSPPTLSLPPLALCLFIGKHAARATERSPERNKRAARQAQKEAGRDPEQGREHGALGG